MPSMLALALAAIGCSGGPADVEISGDGESAAELGDDVKADAVRIVGPRVLDHVQEFANAACDAVHACLPSTYQGHSPTSSRALDFLTSEAYGRRPADDYALGDALAAFALEHKEEFGIYYVIWRQQINLGRGWRTMENRGSITQNHYDHVHVSFYASAP